MPDSSLPRSIARRTRGHTHGYITRLMSPGDLGQVVKPFVFLDIFDMDRRVLDEMAAGRGMGIHPHSGIATVTVFTEGGLRFDDPASGRGELRYGGVEWMRASGGVWHGKELSPADVDRTQGFQLWIALPPELENAEPESRYIEAAGIPQVGPARLVLGEYEGIRSPTPSPAGVNYLLVTLEAGTRWTYRPPAGHGVAWIAVAKGEVRAPSEVRAGEMAVFAEGEAPIALEAGAGEDAVFVLGSAVPHPHELHLGNYSVHTSPQALDAGEQRIEELRKRLVAAGDRRTASNSVPVFR